MLIDCYIEVITDDCLIPNQCDDQPLSEFGLVWFFQCVLELKAKSLTLTLEMIQFYLIDGPNSVDQQMAKQRHILFYQTAISVSQCE